MCTHLTIVSFTFVYEERQILEEEEEDIMVQCAHCTEYNRHG